MSKHTALFSKISILCCCLLFSITSFCWGLLGHRVVAEIGERHLSKKAKKEIKKIIGKESLAWWANWPDFIKSDSTWNHASVWHYVDFPGHISKEEFIKELKAAPGNNLYTQIKETAAQIKDKSLPIEQRQIALRFLIHLIGDLHQPLHVGRDEDQGGNKIVVYWFGNKTNLHSVWDTNLIEDQKYSYSEYSRLLDIAPKDSVSAWQSSPIEDWFYESHVLSDQIYDATPNESKLSYRYNFQFQAMLNQQLLKGGIRLAAIINESLK